MKILVTGNAGFIGFHTAKQLLERGDSVIGLDVVNDYYDINLKEARLKKLEEIATENDAEYHMLRICMTDKEAVDSAFAKYKPECVINLAAQAGVRHSIEFPLDYVQSNIVGFTNILEACRYNDVQNLTYASSSSVYGANTNMPFSEHRGVDHPLQFYAATKRANELMAHAYSNLYQLPTTGLRFFTAYGPWGRPDMALFLFTKNILEGKPIKIFNHGNHMRDFTYIDDIVQGVLMTNDNIAEPNADWSSDDPDPATSYAPYKIYNIGANQPVRLMDYIEAVEDALGMKAVKEMLPLQLGDVPVSKADISELVKVVDYKPQISIKHGVAHFVKWYREFYNV